MARSLLVVLCAVLALCASPMPVLERTFESIFGADGCCDTSCCCAGPTTCGPGEATAPRLVRPCACGHQDGSPVKAAPQGPQVSSAEEAALAAPQAGAHVADETRRVPDDRRAAPEPPPPRDGDHTQAPA